MEFKKQDPAYWRERAKTGLEFIEASKAGRPMNLESPAELWSLACQYFERLSGQPWSRKDYKGKDAVEVDIPTSAPFLWSGFEDFVFEKKGIITLKDYRTASRKDNVEEDPNYARYAPFSEIIRAIDSIISTQKISGALVGAYNSNLVARLEGLVDKSEETVVLKDETKIGFQ